MADQTSYPQVPTSVWWGVRSILNRNPRAKLDDTTLAVQLDVQPAASRQYISELRRLGLLTEEGNATELALRWRMDETYREAANEIVGAAYPDELVQLAPPGMADRAQVERWFMMKGLGVGTAKNKAATYMMLANADPSVPTAPKQNSSNPTPSRTVSKPKGESGASKGVARQEGGSNRTPVDVMPLNVNVQIHISADASIDQIEAIFMSMRKNLYGGTSA